jgi:hypothetical protein
MKYVSPAVSETAFNCPHCGALATQTWYSVHADTLPDRGKPFFADQFFVESLKSMSQDDRLNDSIIEYWSKMIEGRPFIDSVNKHRSYDLNNVWLSDCFNCQDISIWIYDRLIYPVSGVAPQVNPDTPDEIKADYREASAILDFSPRGAAALIRLAIQKLCKHLGQSGKDINSDIKALVAGGLDVRVQRALDAVRVIGNEAVHPGQLDLQDDRGTAESLFSLLNLIVEKMISEPRHVDEVYAKLPQSKRDAIEKRDGK